MTAFSGKLGLQFTVHIASAYTTPQLVDLARRAADRGFDQVWVNDNLGYRQQFVVLAAMAVGAPIALGTAVTVPYFRNPVDLADALATLSELMGGRELSAGISRGDLSMVRRQLSMSKPIAHVRETVAMVQALLRGERVRFGDYPRLVDFYHLQPSASIALAFTPPVPIRFFSGSNGPRMMAIAGRLMDGVLFSGLYITFARLGWLPRLLQPAEDEARARGKRLATVAEVNVSIARSKAEARDFARTYAAHATETLHSLGVTDEELAPLGLSRRHLDDLQRHWDAGETLAQVAHAVPDELVDACFVCGTAEEVVAELEPILVDAQARGVDQVVLSKLGPDYAAAIDALARSRP